CDPEDVRHLRRDRNATENGRRAVQASDHRGTAAIAERQRPRRTMRQHPEKRRMKKRRSRVTIDGLDRAPHRAFMRAMGLDDEALTKPMIGVVSMKGEQTPCKMPHFSGAQPPKAGRAGSGGTPREFSTISVS